MIDSLSDIGGLACGNNDSACVTLLPSWFAANNPADPSDPVAEVEVAFVPQIQPSFYLWQVPQDQVSPPQGTVSLSQSGTLSVSVPIQLQTNISLTPNTPVAPQIITSPFGPRSLSGTFHHGIDLQAATGTPVITVSNGSIEQVAFQNPGQQFTCSSGQQRYFGCGEFVKESHAADGSLESTYCHLETSVPVSSGQSTVAGEVIAASDSTGGACGPHLHFAMTLSGQLIDPGPLLPSLNNLNGYLPYQLALTVDGTIIADTNGAFFDAVNTLSYTFSHEYDPNSLSLLTPGVHTMSLELQSIGLGVRTLQQWNFNLNQTNQATLSVVVYSCGGPGFPVALVSPPDLGINCSIVVGNLFGFDWGALPQSCRVTVPIGFPVSVSAVPSDEFLGWGCEDDSGNETSTTTSPTLSGVLNGNRRCIAAWPSVPNCL